MVAALICGVLGCLIGITGLKRLRADYQAMVMLVLSILATTVIGADTGLFNGDAGLSLIPNPLASVDPARRGWYYVAVVAVVCAAGYLALRRFTTGPLGRALRAVREDEDTATAVGKNVVGLRLVVQAVGGVYAGLSGALLAGFIGGWSPSSWEYVETLALLTAIIVGGLGNDAGVLLGTVIVPVLILQGVQFLPQVKSAPQLTDDLGWIILGLLTIAFVFSRPQGLIPERRPRHGLPAPAMAGPRRRSRPGRRCLAPPRRLPRPRRARLPSPGRLISPRSSPCAPPRGRPPGRVPRPLVPGGVPRAAGGHRSSPWRGWPGTSAVSTRSTARASPPPGSITGLIGPNGAGKSTVLGIISGFITPGRGPRSPSTAATSTRSRATGAPGSGSSARSSCRASSARLTTIENLLVAAPRQRGESAPARRGRPLTGAARSEDELVERALELLSMFGMAEAGRRAGRPPQRRPEAHARGDAGADDGTPAAAARRADGRAAPALAERLEEACLAARRAGISILLVEHELGAVERLCEHVVVMAQGKVHLRGPDGRPPDAGGRCRRPISSADAASLGGRAERGLTRWSPGRGGGAAGGDRSRAALDQELVAGYGDIDVVRGVDLAVTDG